MKKFLKSISIMVSITLIALNNYAQKQSTDPSFNSSMKIEAPDSAIESSPSGLSYSTNLASVSSKVSKNFSKKFKNPSDLRINTLGKFTYIYCITDGVINRVRYDKKGNWDYTIRYYQENLLPKEVRKQVKSTFYDFEIAGVTEVTVGDKTAYLVRIIDGNTWKTVKVLDDEMTITESYVAR